MAMMIGLCALLFLASGSSHHNLGHTFKEKVRFVEKIVTCPVVLEGVSLSSPSSSVVIVSLLSSCREE